MTIKQHIPNSITLLNLTAGIISIYFGVKGSPNDLVFAGIFIFIGALFDFFDGFSARLLGVKSAIGLQLDSLSDMVTFGVAPGFILYQMILRSHGNPTAEGLDYLPFFALLVPWMSAVRLAKFNIDKTQATSFKGLPTPALAILIASLPLIRQELYASKDFWYMVFTNSYFLLSIALFGPLLMVSSFPMFSLKLKTFGWKENMIKYSFLILSLLLLVFLKMVAIPFIILLYLFLSLILFLTDIQG
ncbi:CDP-alcohol phosphatidyltransferase family protein [Candidatus Sulfidibacterium hydrothermale]|uniref:CDP-alcohol phosphatidyltransferase family protein n=1 Tax=Candidatus Sulfidibacterium hydrothermale TaxID=2875962 RepID=UPI001F0AF830|nr:CDP-alcohol phosphatidyltransferase family protein [Candidatus Sulfidibacterium hydrothermale]UBM62754.1 CDP-alcohol phosphatidyltransferase family protein [Candidatus Sulfidibacterium hydrothermale]